jgi:heme/copper-type cytochrome/quinol oxidase subunit 3
MTTTDLPGSPAGPAAPPGAPAEPTRRRDRGLLEELGLPSGIDRPADEPIVRVPQEIEVVGGPPPGYPIGWWGMVLLITTEAMLFVGLISAYFFIRASSPAWPLDHLAPPELGRISLFTVVLLASSIPIFWAEHEANEGRFSRVRVGLALSFVLGASFLVNQLFEYRSLDFRLTDNAYASLFIVITGLHGLHVAAGLIMNGVVQAKAWTGRLTTAHHLTLRLFGMYWHFVDGVWLLVFTSLYLSAHWGTS